ncbi:MAG: heavy metal translocating P-type ATPase, partial [Clostridia bacterium]|nr:heavy metal translocating P-type ATPase [Clostridia bacterium]
MLRIICTVISLTAGSLLLHFFEGIAWGEGLGISLCVLAYLIIGGGLLVQAVKNLFKGKLFDEIFLMTVASLGALILQEYIEACAVVLLYTVGEALQDAAVGRSRKSVSQLLNLKSATANLVADNGDISVIDTDELKVGDIILVKAGERVPSDATVTEGESYLECSALAGEGVPVTVKAGDSCMSGAINVGGA